MTKKLAFKQGVRYGAAVDADELGLGPVAVLMDQLGQQAFSSACFTRQQHGGLGGRHRPNFLEHTRHGQAFGLGHFQGFRFPELIRRKSSSDWRMAEALVFSISRRTSSVDTGRVI